jgi:kinesin family protein 6/9
MSKKDASGGGDGTILVHLRLKPTKKDAGYLGQDDVDPSIVRIHIPEKGVPRAEGYVNNSKTQYSFRFNSILPMKAKQDAVFDVVGKDAVANVLNGINSTIFAYGQTGSGKTFTITV